MNGAKTRLIEYLEGADKRYIIPVYQRKYEWKQNNCRQLYEDLKRIIRERRKQYFLGSIVSSVIGRGALTEFHIIDGQQRITTITLLLLAMRNLIMQKKVSVKNEKLSEEINERFLIAKWAEYNDRVKLRPVKSDVDALNKLFWSDDESEYDNASKLTANYNFFCEQLIKHEITIEELYEAIFKLEIISMDD